MPSSGRRSMRAQLLLNALQMSESCAVRDDYLNAVTFMRAAAESADFKLAAPPIGVPEIVRGDTWKKWRNYFHTNFPTVHRHVNEVLKRLSEPMLDVAEDSGDE